VVVSLLHKVNVGGRNLLSMQALRAVYESLGFEDVRSYVQSGNLVFRIRARDSSRLGVLIENAIEQSFGMRPTVVLRTASEMRDVVRANPFADRPGMEPAKLAVMFLAGEPGEDTRGRLRQLKTEPEELIAGRRELYIYYPDGMGRSKLTGTVFERILGVRMTGRNWNSVTKLLETAEELGLTFHYWHVMDSGKDSVDLLKKLLDRFGARLNYVLVLNQLRGENFDIFAKSGEKERAAELNARVIKLKRLHEPVINKIDAGSTSFWAAKNKSETDVKGLGLLERQRVKVWLNNAYQEIDGVGI